LQQYHGKSKTVKRGTGKARKGLSKKKRKFVGGAYPLPKIGEKGKNKNLAGRGSTRKSRALTLAFANVLTGQGMKKARVLNVLETPSNRHYARQNAITKGTIIQSEIGKIRVTNRVGQDGMINAILIEEAKVEAKAATKASP